ncbi:hypothetical protein H8S33_18130 [Ornithinibacillus sp. BX22]|uniref:Uncharacterized protein n=1 Tax=Ornithinibacillus hominis TaxID=2763055 RepID=A0A923L970_9BACI|nr:hypothetical protein [Ornithinibacillus hominis]MBC5638694.1 hypothetical protein [Ornithinibacillus hominis]
MVYSFFNDYNIVVSKEIGYGWMGKSSSVPLYFVMIEKNNDSAVRQELLHLRVFTSIGQTIRYLAVILQDYVFDERLIENIIKATNTLEFVQVS